MDIVTSRNKALRILNAASLPMALACRIVSTSAKRRLISSAYRTCVTGMSDAEVKDGK
jgi:hypothetical protein